MNNTDKQNLKEKFYEQCKKNVLPKISEMEAIRQKLLKTHNNAKYKNIIKEICINELLSCFDFIERGSRSSIPMSAKNLLNPNFGHITEDSFYGCYNSVEFRVTEAYAQVKCKKDIYSFTERFVFINLVFNKNAKTNVHLCPQFKPNYNKDILCCIILSIICYTFILKGVWFAYVFLGILLILISAMLFNIYHNKAQKINLEDTNFEKNFYVECDNPVEARYILTPAFMERLNELKTVFTAKNNTWVEIENNQVTFAMQTNDDLYEVGDLYTPATDPKIFNKFFDEIIAITEIIDHFKLNERTGL